MPKTVKKTGLLLGFLSLLVLPALADRTNLMPAWNLFSPQQDIEMGRVLADDLERTSQLIENRDANAYIDALGKQLSIHAPGNKYPYQFKIVNDDNVNSWALPGGFIYVTSGLVQAAASEPELAGALAHQIGHVVLRHGTAEVSEAYTDRVPNSAQRRVSVNDAMSRLNIRFQRGAIPLRYSRDEERQADIIATQIMYDAKFDPRQMTQFFHAIANAGSSRTADFFNDHQRLSDHATNVSTELRKLGPLPRNLRGDSPDFRTVNDILANTSTPPSVYDRDTTTGERPELPSSRMVSYRGRDIEFTYPENWRVSEDSDSTSIAPDGGFVSGSLAYGMTIATFDPQVGRSFGRNSLSTQGTNVDSRTLAGATDQLIAQLRQSNPNMRVVRNTQRMRVDGAQATVVELTNDSPIGGSETDWLVAVLRPNGLLRYFIGVAPEREFSDYRRPFERIIASVRFFD